MAKFIISGIASDTQLAHAEALAYYLEKNLPDFHVKVILKGESEWKTWVDHAVKEYGWNDRLSVDRSYLDVNRLDQLIYKASGQLVGNTVDFIAWIKHSYGIQLHFDNLDEIALVNQELHLVALGGRVKE